MGSVGVELNWKGAVVAWGLYWVVYMGLLGGYTGSCYWWGIRTGNGRGLQWGEGGRGIVLGTVLGEP